MSTDLTAGTAVAALATELEFEPVSPELVDAGTPVTGYTRIGGFEGLDVGVWEISAGVSRDTEIDEVFVVIEGSATIEFLDDAPEPGVTSSLEIAVGSVVRLGTGQRTRWTVPERLRKVVVLRP